MQAWMNAHPEKQLHGRIQLIATIVAGAGLGALVTVSSIGAGAIGATILVLLYPNLKPAEIAGTDIAYAVPLTAIAALGHWWLGSINWELLLMLLLELELLDRLDIEVYEIELHELEVETELRDEVDFDERLLLELLDRLENEDHDDIEDELLLLEELELLLLDADDFDLLDELSDDLLDRLELDELLDFDDFDELLMLVALDSELREEVDADELLLEMLDLLEELDERSS
jgi:hypothetical protein